MLRKLKLLKSKKGISQWLSWVLLVVLAVILSVAVFKWASGVVRDRSNDLVRLYDNEECETTSIRIENACQDTQTLYMNITNNNEQRVNGLLFRLFDVFKQPDVREKNLTLYPGRSETVRVLKQYSVKNVEVIPVVRTDENIIVCTSKLTTARVTVC